MEKILRHFTKDKLLINLILISVTMYGLLHLNKVRKEHMPSVDIDKMLIIVTYPGASASDVELNAVIPIEDTLREISGIDEYFSVSMENMAKIQINIDSDITNKQKVKDEIFREISKSNIPDIPDEVDDIQIIDINPKEKAVYTVLLSLKNKEEQTGKNVKKSSVKDLRKLYSMADTLEELLRRVPGVSSINKQGYRENEIHINVIPRFLEAYDISLLDINSAIEKRNVRSSAGSMESLSSGEERSVMVSGQLQNPKEVEDVIIRSGFEQRRIKIKDVANVIESFDKETTRLLVNSTPGVVLSIKKKENADIIDTVEAIKSFFEENKNLYENNFQLTLVNDDSAIISSLLKVVLSNAALGFILVIVILFIFLDLKTSIWTAFGIPFTMMITIAFMYVYNISLNVLTIGAVITVLGMLVDDAIVIAENIYDKKQKGFSGIEAAVQGTKEVILPVSITVLSTIIAFAPMMMIKGTMGKFIYVYPIVIAVTLIGSLFEASFVLPNHLVFNKSKNKIQKSEIWFEKFKNTYGKSLFFALRKRYFVASVFFIMLVFTVIMSEKAIAGFVLFWDNSSEMISVNLTGKPGTSLEESENLAKKVEKKIQSVVEKKDLVSTFITTGAHGGHGFNVENHDHWASIQIKLTSKTNRKKTAEDYAEILRNTVKEKDFPEWKHINIQATKPGPPTGAAVDIKVMSNNDQTTILLLNKIKEYLASIPGVKDIDDDQKKGTSEIKLKFNYPLMAEFGMNVQTVASTIRTALEGNIASYIQTNDKRIEFRVQIDPNYKVNKKFLENLLIPNSTGRLIRLGEIASFHLSTGSSSIKHYNGNQSATVFAEIDSDITTSKKVNYLVKEKFKNISKEYTGTYLIFSGEEKETTDTLPDLYSAFLMAAFGIYFIVILLFRSFSQPFIILSSIPFGLIGVLSAFTAHGIPLSFMGFIGIIGMSGVVINDNVILVEMINRMMAGFEGKSRKKIFTKIVAGTKQRLRPVLLTTLTTVFGLMPTVYGIGGEARMMVPTVMAMAYGLLFATLVTLYYAPVVYMILLDVKNLFRKK